MEVTSIRGGSPTGVDSPVPPRSASLSRNPRTTSTTLKLSRLSREILFGVLFLSRNPWSSEL